MPIDDSKVKWDDAPARAEVRGTRDTPSGYDQSPRALAGPGSNDQQNIVLSEYANEADPSIRAALTREARRAGYTGPMDATAATDAPPPIDDSKVKWEDEPPRVEVRGTSADETSLKDTLTAAAGRFGMGALHGARDLATGLTTGAASVGNAILAPADLLSDAMNSRALGSSNKERRQAADQYGKEHADTSSVNYAIAHATPEMIETGGPIAGAGRAIAGNVLTRTLAGRLAPAVGDVAANAAYAGGRSIGEGQSLPEAGTAAAYGGGGALGARVLTRTLGGIARPFISDNARTLLGRDVVPTPGQMFGDGLAGRTLRSIEDKATSFPLAGDVINGARTRSLEDYGRAEVRRAIAPIRGNVTGTGIEAVERAQQQVSNAYDRALPAIMLDVPTMTEAARDGLRAAARNNPMLDPRQAAQLQQFVNLRIGNLIEQGAPIDGRLAKNIDTELGHWARRYSRSPSPQDGVLGDAFRDLQASWRDAMARGSNDPAATALLNAANQAHRNMLPIVRAADRASARAGVFTPHQLNMSSGAFDQQQGEFNRAAQNVLPSRVPDSGTTGRALLAVGAGAGLHAAGVGIPAAAFAAVLYSRAGIRALTEGMGALLPAETRHYIGTLQPQQAAQYLDHLAQRFPHLQPGLQESASALARQVMQGRGQQPQEATP